MIGRIHGSEPFRRVRAKGTRVRSSMVWCTMLLDPSLDRPHVGFTIGRTMGHAVARNRARRRLRALMSEYSATAGLRPGWYVLGAAPEVASCAAPALRRDVERLVRRLNAIDVREDAT